MRGRSSGLSRCSSEFCEFPFEEITGLYSKLVWTHCGSIKSWFMVLNWWTRFSSTWFMIKLVWTRTASYQNDLHMFRPRQQLAYLYSYHASKKIKNCILQALKISRIQGLYQYQTCHMPNEGGDNQRRRWAKQGPSVGRRSHPWAPWPALLS